MIKNFNFQKEWNEIKNWKKHSMDKRLEELLSINEKSSNNFWMSSISTSSSDEYAEISMNRDFRKIIGSLRARDVVEYEYKEKIMNLCVRSISYVYSILALDNENTSNDKVLTFLFENSLKSGKEKDFIKFWILLRNKWEHNHRFANDKHFRLKYFSKTRKLDLEVITEVINKIFVKVNKSFPSEGLTVNTDDLPWLD